MNNNLVNLRFYHIYPEIRNYFYTPTYFRKPYNEELQFSFVWATFYRKIQERLTCCLDEP